jgi:hypothetical protein
MKSVIAKMAVVVASLSMLAGISAAADAPVATPAKKQHNMVIQLSEDNEKVANLALNNAVNVQKEVGIDNINIEVVAYGPGLKMMLKDSPVAGRIKDLALQNVSFAACGNTIKKWEKDNNAKAEIAEGAHVVPAGLVRILNLQEQGWSYVRP